MIGSNNHPVLVNYFQRDSARVNSNMIVIGKSGGGKSFTTKSILAHLAADNTKIYICDPEKEYVGMAAKMHGGSIDVGNAGSGRFNPFHIYPAMMDEDEDGEEYDDTFESHLRFLESFFKIVMEGIRADALEALNGLVVKLYKQRGIDKDSNFNKVDPEDFPIFDNLYQLAKQSYEDSSDEFAKINYRVLVTYLEKFASGGRYSGLWNGPSSIQSRENFFVFNFLTLLANKNAIVANAQMLLVFKYLDGEIIKNREYNTRYGVKRRIIIVIDEAHVFIDEQKPIALDFMFQMAKRIRKYDGMQIIITQNIKDFVGSPLIAKKSAAIINASQYSMIMPLAPNDMTDLVALYKNAGGINKREQQAIISAPRGQAFFIYGPVSRSTIQIQTSDEIRKLFE
jgi:type IV secretory pathway VirB4 component